MKLQDELKNVIKKMQGFKSRIPEYARELKASGNYKDFEVRLANDCLRFAVGSAVLCEWYEKYNCNDTHTTTLAKKALAAVYDVNKMEEVK